MGEAHDQARITRQRNKALRDARRAERDAQEQADKALVLENLRAILKDQTATTGQRIFAVCVLDKMNYYGFVPHDVKPGRIDGDALIADFAERLKTHRETSSK